MGNIDVIRKTLGYHKTKRGSNTKPGFLTWYTIFQYLLYQTFCVYTYYLLEDKLNKFCSFRRFQDARKHIISFKEFLYTISLQDSFCISEFDDYYPGLKDKFNSKMRSVDLDNDKSEEADDEKSVDKSSIKSKKNDKKYKALEQFNDESSTEYKT